MNPLTDAHVLSILLSAVLLASVVAMTMKKIKDLPDSTIPTNRDLSELFRQLFSLPGADVEKERLEERLRLFEKLKGLGWDLYDGECHDARDFFELGE